MIPRSACAAPTRRLVVAALLLAPALPAVVPASAGAQASSATAPAPRRWTAVRVAKWALLGAAAGFGVYALSHSRRADRWYDDLRTLCVRTPASCGLEAGRYVAPEAEALYRGSVREDRRAQVGILGGQVTLLGGVALFVYDLRNHRGPGNIPYPGAALRPAMSRRGALLGVRVRF